MEELAKQRSKQLEVLTFGCNSTTNSWYRCTCLCTQLLARGSTRISFERAEKLRHSQQCSCIASMVQLSLREKGATDLECVIILPCSFKMLIVFLTQTRNVKNPSSHYCHKTAFLCLLMMVITMNNHIVAYCTQL